MVPLPYTPQGLAIEILLTVVRGMRYCMLTSTRDCLRLKPCTRGTAQIALKTNHWPSVLPGNRGKGNRTSDGVEVHHQQGPPLSTLVFNDAALMDVGTGRSIFVDRRNTKTCSVLTDAILHILRNLCQRCSIIAKGLISCDGDGFIGSPNAFGTRTERTTVGLVVRGDEIVHAIDFVHVMTLTHCIALRNDGTLGSLNGTAHVWLQLRTLYLSISMNSVNLAVIIEEYREVVDASLHVVMLPWSPNIFGGITLQALTIDIRKNIEQSIGIANGRCPDALPVNLLVVTKREGIVRKVKTVETIADIRPVHQILRMQNDKSRHAVHRRPCQIIVIAYTDDVRVGELVIEQRVGERTVTIVGRP